VARERYVLDASALLCLLFEEPGAERVEAVFAEAPISAANHAEVLAKLVDRGEPAADAIAGLQELDLEVVAFDRAQAEIAAGLRSQTRSSGLSLGDRACLALATSRNAVALTTDRAWADLDVGVRVEVVR